MIEPLRLLIIAIGLYDQTEAGLSRRLRVETDVAGPRTVIPELAGQQRPDLVLVNDDDRQRHEVAVVGETEVRGRNVGAQIGRRQIFMTGDGDQRTLEPPGHVLDETRLAAAGWSFQNHWQARGVRRGEQIDFAVYGQVIRLFGDLEFFNSAFGHMIGES